MIVFVVTFFLFTIEALLHYNYGSENLKKDNKFNFPDNKNFMKILSTVFIFSYLTSLIVRILHRKFHIYN